MDTPVELQDVERRARQYYGDMSDHDRIVEICVRLEVLQAMSNNLACRTNDKRINPVMRLGEVEAQLQAMRSSSIKAGGAGGLAGGGLITLLFEIGKKIIGG